MKKCPVETVIFYRIRNKLLKITPPCLSENEDGYVENEHTNGPDDRQVRTEAVV